MVEIGRRTYIDCESDKVDVRVRRLDCSEQRILVAVTDLRLPQEPEDLGPRQSLDLALQVQLPPLLPAARLPEERGFDPLRLGRVLVLHGQTDVVGLLAMFVLHDYFVVSSILVG